MHEHARLLQYVGYTSVFALCLHISAPNRQHSLRPDHSRRAALLCEGGSAPGAAVLAHSSGLCQGQVQPDLPGASR